MGDLIKTLFPDDKSKNGIKITKKQRKYIMGLLTMIAIGILAMTFSDFGTDKAENSLTAIEKIPPSNQETYLSKLTQIEKSMEDRLQQVLSQIEGVGQVVVNITLNSSVEYQYAINTKVDETVVNEKAQDGSTRTTNETREDAQIVMKGMTQGQNEPVVIKEIRPEITGVMIVAEGANDLILRENISQAVQTVLNIPAHRVTVLPKGK